MIADSLAELKDYGADFEAAIASERALLVAQIRAELDGIGKPLAAYLASGRSLIDAVSTGKFADAQAELGGFDARFDELEGAMSAVSDDIEALSAELTASAVGNDVIAAVINWSSLVAVLALSVVLSVARRSWCRDRWSMSPPI